MPELGELYKFTQKMVNDRSVFRPYGMSVLTIKVKTDTGLRENVWF